MQSERLNPAAGAWVGPRSWKHCPGREGLRRRPLGPARPGIPTPGGDGVGEAPPSEGAGERRRVAFCPRFLPAPGGFVQTNYGVTCFGTWKLTAPVPVSANLALVALS